MGTKFSKFEELRDKARRDFIEAEDKWIANPNDNQWVEREKAAAWWEYLDDQDPRK